MPFVDRQFICNVGHITYKLSVHEWHVYDDISDYTWKS